MGLWLLGLQCCARQLYPKLFVEPQFDVPSLSQECCYLTYFIPVPWLQLSYPFPSLSCASSFLAAMVGAAINQKCTGAIVGEIRVLGLCRSQMPSQIVKRTV